MKPKIIIIAVFAGLFALGLFEITGCANNANGSETIKLGSTTITVPASTVQEADNLFASAVQTGVSGVESQLLTTGSVNARQIAAAQVNGLAKNLQGYVGTTMPPSVASSSVSVAAMGNSASQNLTGVVVSQQMVNDLYSAAAKIAPPAASPTPTPDSP